MAPGQPARCAFEYKRRGVAAVFVLTEPLRGWRKVVVRRSPDADRLRTCRQAPGRCAFRGCRAGHPRHGPTEDPYRRHKHAGERTTPHTTRGTAQTPVVN